jgi:hypothetical protein
MTPGKPKRMAVDGGESIEKTKVKKPIRNTVIFTDFLQAAGFWILVPTCINQSNNVSFAAGGLLPWSIRRVPRSDSSWQ